MSITYEVDEEANVIYVKAIGKIAGEDLIRYQKELMSDPRIKPDFRLLFDASAAEVEGITHETILAFVELDKEFRAICPEKRTAIVVRDKQAFELAEEFEKHAQSRAGVFINIDVARIWLGI